MVEPTLTVHDFRTELSVEVTDPGDEELLRNYAFNISQGIVQRVSRFSDALVLIDENKSSQPAPSEGDASAAGVNGGGVMGFGRKSKVYNQEKPARKASEDRIPRENEEEAAAAARKAVEQDTKLAALEAKFAARQAAEQSAEMAALKAEIAAAAAREVAEQVTAAVALKAAEQDTKMATLEAKIAEMQALAALRSNSVL